MTPETPTRRPQEAAQTEAGTRRPQEAAPVEAAARRSHEAPAEAPSRRSQETGQAGASARVPPAAGRETPAAAVAASADEPDLGSPRALAAANTVKNNVVAAMAIGTVPLPLFDTAALLGVQMRMIQQIAHRYGHTYSEKAVRSTIYALVGSNLSVVLGIGAASLLKSVPGLGWALAGLGLPALAGATTYALGHTYIKHFEEGGTIVDLNAEKLRGYYNRQFAEGRAEVAGAAAA